MAREATDYERRVHGWCLSLRTSQGFLYYQERLGKLAAMAHEQVCSADAPNRDYEAGRLSAFTEAAQVMDREYAKLAKIVEVVS